MKIFVISDIHGSYTAAKKAWQIIEKNSFDRILVLGDVLYHGPRNPLPEGYDPMKVAELLNRKKDIILGVRGNCDAEIDRVLCEFPLSADYETFTLGSREVFMTHGHIHSPQMHMPLKKGSIFLYGHFHVPAARYANGIYYLNPGSCSLPKEGSAKSFAFLDEDSFTICDLDGNPLNSIRFID